MNPHPHRHVRAVAAIRNSVGLALVVLSLAGCSDDRPPATAALSGQLTIKGSNTFGAARDLMLFVQRDPGQRILDDLGFVRRFEKRLDSLIPE